jgi:fibronectin type 3 domain-containing protein
MARETFSKTLLVLSGLLLASLSWTACGKRRPPLPPVERVPQRTELLSGVQRGSEVILSWPAPRVNAPDTSVQSIRRIDVYRLAERPNAPLPLTEIDFGARSTLIGSVPYDTIRTSKETVSYVDNLELAGQPTRLRYAIRYVNAAGQRAAFSNFLLIEPSARISEAPQIVGKEEAESGITIIWHAPTRNIDGSTPVNLLGYNIYRSSQAQGDSGQTPLNSALIQETRYVDKTFRFGQEYDYVVRAVSLGTNASQVESLNSNLIHVAPGDVYPPSAPSGITIAPAPGRLSLFFAPNPEPDVAGYILYRSTDPDLPKDQWTRITPTLLTRTTYQDDRVESGKRYYYYLTAQDNSGNVSQPSEVVSETVP